MDLVFKSKLYREEYLRYGLILVQFIWGLSTTVLALRNSEQIVLIAVSKNETRVISENFDPVFDTELQNFLKKFVENYYTYNQSTFAKLTGMAADLMSESLWDKSKEKLLEVEAKLKEEPLTQESTILSIDLVMENRAEVVLEIKIKSRITEKKIRVKAIITFKPAKRSKRNPWGFEITEIQDAIL